jgi:hypothetical protein
MTSLRFSPRRLAVLPALLGGAVLLALLDRPGFQLQGWLAYSLLLGLGALLFAGVRRLVAAPRLVTAVAAAAFLLRLIAGVAMSGLLPQLGYPDNEVHQAGYVFYDAFRRDVQARDLAASDAPLLSAFSEDYSGDQYGGTLWLSAVVYRALSRDIHRPNLILVLTAVAGALGTLFVWKASRAWFGDAPAGAAAWIFALYPEAVLLGASQMREAFLIPLVGMAFFGLTDLQGTNLRRSPWLALAAVLLFLASPPVAVAALGLLLVAWWLEPGQRRSWKPIALSGVLLILGLAAVTWIFSRYPSLERAGPWRVLLEWLQYNAEFQSYLLERASGWVQKLIREAGSQWQLAIVLLYGLARPVLPAQLVVPGASIMRAIGIFRGLGWYLLAPLLIYSLTILPRSQFERRRQVLWMALTVFGWILLGALIAGGDQWDNPRYRAILLAWQAPLAGWAWVWARQQRDAWLTRLLAVEGLFVLLFTEWYISRYYRIFERLNFWVMVGVILAAAALILVGGWARDRARSQIK